MAKARNLAGLAALGALGYMMTRKQDGSNVPVDDRGDMPRGVGMGESAESEYAGRAAPAVAAQTAPTRTQTTPARMETPDQTVARVGADAMSRGRRERIKNPQRGPSFEEISAANRAPSYRRTMGAMPSAADIDAQMQAMARGRMEREPAGVESRDPNFIYNAAGQKVRPMKKGGTVKMASGGSVSSASKRADGIAQRGKTKGRIC